MCLLKRYYLTLKSHKRSDEKTWVFYIWSSVCSLLKAETLYSVGVLMMRRMVMVIVLVGVIILFEFKNWKLIRRKPQTPRELRRNNNFESQFYNFSSCHSHSHSYVYQWAIRYVCPFAKFVSVYDGGHKSVSDNVYAVWWLISCSVSSAHTVSQRLKSV